MSELPRVAPHAPEGFLAWVAVLVHAHRRALVGLARREGLDADEALDVVQEAFISFMKLPQARAMAREGDDSLKVLSVMVRHLLNNRRRKRHRHQLAHQHLEQVRADVQVESSEQLIARAEEVGRAYGCLYRMAGLQRQVVMLSLLDGESPQAIAAELGVSAGYARVLLHRARTHLRTCDTFEGPDEPAALSAGRAPTA